MMRIRLPGREWLLGVGLFAVVVMGSARGSAAADGAAPSQTATPAPVTEQAGSSPAKPKKSAASAKPAAAKPGAEATLQGDLTCAKCGLHESSTCQTVLVVKDKGQTEKYYLAKNDVAAAEHEKVCGGSVTATVTGTVSEKDGHKLLTATKVTVK